MSLERDPARQVSVHQVVHGYREGHRLLTSSVQLPTQIQNLLGRLTDAGDSSVADGFPSLLAGFPMPELGSYAISKVWPATEVERPGAVWAHTLLVPFDDLSFITPKELDSALRRPSFQDLDQYKSQIIFRDSDPESVSIHAPDEVSVVIWALYGSPIRPVCADLTSLDSSFRQLCLLAILMQQWSALRLSFSFTEGTKWERRLDGPFDLHVTTKNGLREIARGREEFRIIAGQPKTSPPSWARRAASELFQGHELSSYLEKFAEGSDRELFPQLLETWEVLASPKHNDDSVRNLLSTMSRHFPAKKQMAELKRYLFAKDAQPRYLYVNEAAVLRVLSETVESNCVSPVDLDIQKRASELWARSPNEAARILGGLANGNPGTEIAAEVTLGFAEAISPTELVSWLGSNARAVSLLVAVKPMLLKAPELWSLPPEQLQPLLVEGRGSLDKEGFGIMLQTALNHGEPSISKLLVKEWPEVSDQLVALVDQRQEWVSEIPMTALTKYAKTTKLASNIILLEVLERGNRKDISKIPLSHWLQLVSSDEIDAVHLDSLIRMFMVSLQRPRKPADTLSARLFSHLYRRAYDEELTEEHIAELRPVLKDPEHWDVAQELALSLAEAFRKMNTWRTSELLAIYDPEAFARLLEEDAKHHKESTLAGVLAQSVPNGVASEWQAEAIADVLEKYARKSDLITILSNLLRKFVT